VWNNEALKTNDSEYLMTTEVGKLKSDLFYDASETGSAIWKVGRGAGEDFTLRYFGLTATGGLKLQTTPSHLIFTEVEMYLEKVPDLRFISLARVVPSLSSLPITTPSSGEALSASRVISAMIIVASEYLTAKEVARCAGVCRAWREMAHYSRVWYHRVDADFPRVFEQSEKKSEKSVEEVALSHSFPTPPPDHYYRQFLKLHAMWNSFEAIPVSSLRSPPPAWFTDDTRGIEPIEIAIDGPCKETQQLLMRHLGAGVASVGKVKLQVQNVRRLMKPKLSGNGDAATKLSTHGSSSSLPTSALTTETDPIDVILYHPPHCAKSEMTKLVSSQRSMAFKRASFVIICYSSKDIGTLKRFMLDSWGIKLSEKEKGKLVRSTKQPPWSAEPLSALPDWALFNLVDASDIIGEEGDGPRKESGSSISISSSAVGQSLHAFAHADIAVDIMPEEKVQEVVANTIDAYIQYSVRVEEKDEKKKKSRK
tara:strand:+ start:125 stop:1567 length:1443 start_codon:yes stop_codon:yes gene_type:complete